MSVFLIGLSVIADKNCTVSLGIPGQTNATFTLTANVPSRIYVVGGGSLSGTLAYFDLKITDTSGAKLYFGKAQVNSSSDINYQSLFAQIMRNHLYNSKRSWGDVGVLTSTPTFGTWAVGNTVYNATPSASGFIGWVCIASGTPSTWKTFGAISA